MIVDFRVCVCMSNFRIELLHCFGVNHSIEVDMPIILNHDDNEMTFSNTYLYQNQLQIFITSHTILAKIFFPINSVPYYKHTVYQLSATD